MPRSKIPYEKLLVNPHDLWKNQWFLLASGDFKAGAYNAMTVAWGSMGYMWQKPFVQVVVRPTRYTYEFMEKYNTFTLNGFSKSYEQALLLMGSKSGRDCAKIQEAGLTPSLSNRVTAPSFQEAELVIECNKIYWDDFNSNQFIDSSIENHYPQKDYHRIYFGEVVVITGESQYIR